LLLLTGAALGAVLLSSCATSSGTVSLPPVIEGAEFAGNQACVDCHADYVRKFPTSAHGRFHQSSGRLTGATGCESCHGPGSRHVATGQAKFIVNPGKDPAACLQCHVDIHADFQMPVRHPVPEGRMNCVQCHDPHGPDIMKPAGGLAMARLNQGCAECHREQSRPVIYEHEALREGCTVCHQPHGSPHEKLLTQRDNTLCLKCHLETQLTGGQLLIGKQDHTQLIRQGSCWSAGCHQAVHGSNLSPKLRF